MKIIQQIFIKRWKPILEEYEKIQNKVIPVPFALLKTYVLLIISVIKNSDVIIVNGRKGKNRMIPCFLPKEGPVRDPGEPPKQLNAIS